MDFAGERYYKLNKIFLICFGLWPYQTRTLKKIQIIFFQTLFISFLICQCNTFLIKKYSMDRILKILLFIILTCIFIVKYNACLLLTDNIKYIFDRVRYDWNILKAQTELEIIRKYASYAKLFMIGFILLIISSSLGFVVIVCLPHVLNVIIPMNESRPQQTLILVEYFVDEETYLIAILTHIMVAMYAGNMTIMSIASLHIAYALHTCAMFRIASYRIENIFNENIQQMPKNIKQYIFYNKLIQAVYVHRRAIDLANILTNSFATLYFVLLGLDVALMSVSLLNFYNAVISLEKVDLLIIGACIMIQLYYVFVGNYVGQDVIDNSISIFQATYNAHWYAAPLYMQKLILFIMQRSYRKSALTAGGLFDASLEGFAKLMSMSISYVMVLQSMGAHKENHEKHDSYV